MRLARRHLLLATAGASAALAAPALAQRGGGAGATREVTDVAGRTVRVPREVRRVLLGEGRLTYAVAALDREAPFARVVGWRDDLKKNDPDTYAAYRARWPEADRLPTFGGVKDGTFDVEQAIALRPDVVLMNLEARAATEEARLDAKLAAVGVPVAYVDFRDQPSVNTEPSLRLLGAVLGREERAAALIAYRREGIARVTDRLAATPDLRRPRVMVERAGGYDAGCCMSFGGDNFGRMVAEAGGENIAARLIPGTFGVVNPEQVVASDPEVVVVTGSNWSIPAPGGAWVGVGPGADPSAARERLARLMDRPAYRPLRVARSGRVHAIWHQFYDSPYQFVAVQALATWLHPSLFGDLDPDATFRDFHERFLPVAYRPGYWVSLPERQAALAPR